MELSRELRAGLLPTLLVTFGGLVGCGPSQFESEYALADREPVSYLKGETGKGWLNASRHAAVNLTDEKVAQLIELSIKPIDSKSFSYVDDYKLLLCERVSVSDVLRQFKKSHPGFDIDQVDIMQKYSNSRGQTGTPKEICLRVSKH